MNSWELMESSNPLLMFTSLISSFICIYIYESKTCYFFLTKKGRIFPYPNIHA